PTEKLEVIRDMFQYVHEQEKVGTALFWTELIGGLAAEEAHLGKTSAGQLDALGGSVDAEAGVWTGESRDVGPGTAADVHDAAAIAGRKDALDDAAHDVSARQEPPVLLLDGGMKLKLFVLHRRASFHQHVFPAPKFLAQGRKRRPAPR